MFHQRKSVYYYFHYKDEITLVIREGNKEDKEKANEPIKDSKDLFISGFVKTPASDDEPESYNWSNSVRLTRNGKLNNYCLGTFGS